MRSSTGFDVEESDARIFGGETLDAAREWLDRGRELAGRLTDERNELIRRITEIDEALKQLPRPSPPLFRAFEELTSLLEEEEAGAMSRADLVRRIVASAPAGMTASEVVDEAAKVIDVGNGHIVRATLSRLAKSGEMVAQGEIGKQVYRIAPRQAE